MFRLSSPTTILVRKTVFKRRLRGSCVGSNCTFTGVPGTPGGPWQFGWGASGHLRTAVDPDYTPENAMLSLHWDGGSLLFVSNTLGSTASAPTVLYLGGLGVMDAKGNLEVWDRDASGTQESAHSATWFSGWNGAPSYTIGGGTVSTGSHSGTIPTEVVSPMPGACLHNNTPTNASVCPVSDPFAFTPIQQPRSDGYSYSRRMGSGTYQRSLNFQGVRVYDNTSAQWLTPDFYAGTASDPMSQQPFMWNNNNPVAYADPSGYESGAVAETCALNKCKGAGPGPGVGHAAVKVLKAIWASKALDYVAMLISLVSELPSGTVAPEEEGATGSDVTSITYTARVIARADSAGPSDLGHNFPNQLDKDILENGTVTRGKNGYIQFNATGTKNGKAYEFQIGGTIRNGILEVTHRVAIPIKAKN